MKQNNRDKSHINNMKMITSIYSNENTTFKARVLNIFKGLGASFAIALSNICLMLAISIIFWGAESNEKDMLYINSFGIIVILLIYSILTLNGKITSLKLSKIIKRFIDIIFAATSIWLLSPVFIVTAIFIRMDAKGPILYRQTRVGQDGKLFDCFVFRTLNHTPEGNKISIIGKFLRKTSIDMLPMFINVLIGEMSLVGPYSRHPQRIEQLTDKEKRVLSVKPGLTGLWQISIRRDNPNVEKMIELDLYYINNWSLHLDLEIMIKTVPLVLFGKS